MSNSLSNISHISCVWRGWIRWNAHQIRFLGKLLSSWWTWRNLWGGCSVFVLSKNALLMKWNFSNDCFRASRWPSSLRMLEFTLDFVLNSQMLLLIKWHISNLILIHENELLSWSSRLLSCLVCYGRKWSWFVWWMIIETVFLLNSVNFIFLHFQFQFQFPIKRNWWQHRNRQSVLIHLVKLLELWMSKMNF